MICYAHKCPLLLLLWCLLSFCPCSPLTSPDTLFAIAYFYVYASDVLLNFFVAFYQDGELVTDLASIASEL